MLTHYAIELTTPSKSIVACFGTEIEAHRHALTWLVEGDYRIVPVGLTREPVAASEQAEHLLLDWLNWYERDPLNDSPSWQLVQNTRQFLESKSRAE